MRRLTILTFAVALGAASIGCDTAANTNVNKTVTNANPNVAVVVPNNSNMAANTGMTGNTMMNSNLSRADFDKDKDRYAKEAKDAGRTVGSGVNDSWLWTKTRAAMLAATDLRESTINVDVSNEIVTLTGTVANAAQKTKAEEVAKGIEGVKSVKNDLKVQAGDSMTNQMVGGNGNTKTMNSNANMKK